MTVEPPAHLAMALLGYVLLLSSCTLWAPTAVHAQQTSTGFLKTWTLARKTTCRDSLISMDTYTTLKDAQTACAASTPCSGVHDSSCLGSEFKLCDSNSAPIHNSYVADCFRAKPKSFRTRGVTIADRWCSNSCCCDKSNSSASSTLTQWHGELCGDYNECASSPCQNGGTCTESWSDANRVNDYYRKYRCECMVNASGHFGGHNCEGFITVTTTNTACVLTMGVKNTAAATNSVQHFKQFQAALDFLHVTIQSSNADFQTFCGSVFDRMDKGGACQQHFEIKNSRGVVVARPLLDCKKKPEQYVALKICVEPCMLDSTVICCFVPAIFASWFPCCRQLKCCPDEATRRRTQGGAGLAISVTVAVDVQSNTPAVSKFAQLKACLFTHTNPQDCTVTAFAISHVSSRRQLSGAQCRDTEEKLWAIVGHKVPGFCKTMPQACTNPAFAPFCAKTCGRCSTRTSAPTAALTNNPTAVAIVGSQTTRCHDDQAALHAAMSPGATCAMFKIMGMCKGGKPLCNQTCGLCCRDNPSALAAALPGASCAMVTIMGMCDRHGNSCKKSCGKCSASTSAVGPGGTSTGVPTAVTTRGPTSAAPTSVASTDVPTATITNSPATATTTPTAAVATTTAKSTWVCKHGVPVSCSDGVKNGDEVSTDCGGSCGANPGSVCGDSFKAFKKKLKAKTPGSFGASFSTNLTDRDFVAAASGPTKKPCQFESECAKGTAHCYVCPPAGIKTDTTRKKACTKVPGLLGHVRTADNGEIYRCQCYKDHESADGGRTCSKIPDWALALNAARGAGSSKLQGDELKIEFKTSATQSVTLECSSATVPHVAPSCAALCKPPSSSVRGTGCDIPVPVDAGGPLTLSGLVFSRRNWLLSSLTLRNKGTLSRCIFEGNSVPLQSSVVANSMGAMALVSASKSGGAITATGGPTSIDLTYFVGNHAEEHGGAIFVSGQARVSNSYFIRNRAKVGGAIYNQGVVTIFNTVFIANQASSTVGTAGYKPSTPNQYKPSLDTRGAIGGKHVTLSKVSFS